MGNGQEKRLFKNNIVKGLDGKGNVLLNLMRKQINLMLFPMEEEHINKIQNVKAIKETGKTEHQLINSYTLTTILKKVI